MSIEFILLPVFLLLGLFDTLKGMTDYRVFKTLSDSSERQKILRRWVVQSLTFMGMGSLAALALMGQLRSITTMPAVFSNVLPQSWRFERAGKDFIGILSGFGGGLLLGALVLIVMISRQKRKAAPAASERSNTLAIGDFEALIPRNGAERGWAALLSLNAGVSEELFYRLTMPLLLYGVLGNAIAAFAIAAALFGLAHCYQGWTGILMTMLLGLLFTAFYLASGQLWMVMVLHALIDLNSLLLQPLIRRGLRPATPEA